MEMAGKFPRIRSGNGSTKVGRKREEQEEDERPGKRPSAALDIANSPGGLLCGWPSSRIVRVSRASGGKDRHSKVWTSKGLRDRRVRLSVNTAIQFYDLQDRLGYDQPSKAVEWLLKAAAASIDELPSINTSFPSTPGKQLSDEKRATEMEMAEELYQHHQQQQQQQQGNTFSKSACSSTSETSKGSGLSLSRCESRMKARERARGRAAEKEKAKEKPHQNVSQSSFTDLLTGNGNANTRPSPNRESPASSRQWCSAPMDYFAAGMLGLSSTPSSSANLLGQIHTPPLFNVPGEHYSFLPDHIASNGNGHGNDAGHDYNLNFSISPSGYAGFSRGTLQSNSSSLPRFPSSSSSLFTATAPPLEEDHHHHHHFLPGFGARLQLCYGDGDNHSDQKGKVKN